MLKDGKIDKKRVICPDCGEQCTFINVSDRMSLRHLLIERGWNKDVMSPSTNFYGQLLCPSCVKKYEGKWQPQY